MTELAALPARGPVRFTIDGDLYELPVLPTTAWLEAFALPMPAAWAQLIPTCLPPEQRERIERRIHADPRDDAFDIDHLEKYALQVLGAVCGVDFHVAQRLILAARADWLAFDGWCGAHGLDPTTTHISRLCAVVYRLRMEACEKDSERFAVRSRLWAPPDGTRASGRSWNDDPDMSARLDQLESDAFMAMFQ